MVRAVTFIMYTEHDTDLHGVMCDAFLQWDGYVTLNDALVRIMTMVGDGDSRTAWHVMTAAHAGAA